MDIVEALYLQYPDLDKETNERISKDKKREKEMQQVFAATQEYQRTLDNRASAKRAAEASARKRRKPLSTHFSGISQTQLSKFETEVTLYQDGAPIDSDIETAVRPAEDTKHGNAKEKA